MSTLTIIRGLPGSGKSTLAEKMRGVVNIEADDYFINQDGEYQFNVEKIGEAHLWCQRTARSELEKGYDVVVSNTFTTLKEMRPYFYMAKEVGAEFTVITCQGHFKDVHGVPEDTLSKMAMRFFYGDVIYALEKT
jgi:predicted kinase